METKIQIKTNSWNAQIKIKFKSTATGWLSQIYTFIFNYKARYSVFITFKQALFNVQICILNYANFKYLWNNLQIWTEQANFLCVNLNSSQSFRVI